MAPMNMLEENNSFVKPKITWVFTNRNDGYNKSLSKLISKSLSLNKIAFENSGADFEILFVDYGSDQGFQKDINDLESKYPFFRAINLGFETGLPLDSSLAINFGVSQARASDLILVGSIDQFFTVRSMRNLVGYLNDETGVLNQLGLLCVPRRYIDNRYGDSFLEKPSDDILHFFSSCSASKLKLKNQKINISSGIGFLAFTYEFFEKMGPFKSRIGHGYSDVDYGLRASRIEIIGDLFDFGVYVNKFPRVFDSGRAALITTGSAKPSNYLTRTVMDEDFRYKSINEQKRGLESIKNEQASLGLKKVSIYKRLKGFIGLSRNELIKVIIFILLLRISAVRKFFVIRRLLKPDMCEVWLPLDFDHHLMILLQRVIKHSPIVFFTTSAQDEALIDKYVELTVRLCATEHESSVAVVFSDGSFNLDRRYRLRRRFLCFCSPSEDRQRLDSFLKNVASDTDEVLLG